MKKVLQLLCAEKDGVRQIFTKSHPINAHVTDESNMRSSCLFTPRVAGSGRGLILLPSKEGHSPFSSHDDHRVVLKSGNTQPINYSRGRRGQSLAWNWARSYQSVRAIEGDSCLWDSLTLSITPVFHASLVLHFSFSLPFCSLCACHRTCLHF